jgi:hypothetical protein
MRLMGLGEDAVSWTETPESLSNRNSDITCRALHVALCAVQVHIAWHSGVISGEVAMAAIEQQIVGPGQE